MDYSRRGIRLKQRQLSSKGTKIKKMIALTFVKALLISILAGGIIGACLAFGMYKGILATTPDITALDVTPTGYATTLYDADGHQMVKLVAENSNRTYVSMDKIPQDLCDAFVAIEDSRFYQHNGIDIYGIARALATGIKNRHFSQGASTITQQLIKNSVFNNFMNEEGFDKYKRKIQEQYLAIELEKKLTKEQILELYMNTINLGHNTLGVQAASMRYFGKPVYELNLSECATIAGITQNPAANDPITHPEKNAERREKVLRDMRDQGFITQAEYDAAMADDVYARITETNVQITESEVYTYFEDEVIEQVAEDLTDMLIAQGYTETQASSRAYNMLYSGGLSIYTTQDPRIQSICDEIYSNEENYPENTKWLLSFRLSIGHANGETENFSTEMYKAYYKEIDPNFNLLYSSQDEAYEAIKVYEDAVMSDGDEIIAESISLTPQPQVSLTVEDQSTGYVVAMVGGRGIKESSRSLNRASNTMRQPGSTFKVVSTYAPALDAAGITLANVYMDEPFKYETGRPVSNWYGGAYKGPCTVRYGIEQSLNIIAVKVLTIITPQLAFKYLLDFGFTTLIERRVESDGRVTTDVQQALALGGITDGVTNMELNAAYATIANHGMYMEPLLYTRILDHDGNVLIDRTSTQDQHRVIKETTAFLLTDAMVDVVTKGTGTAVNFGGMAIAGKTGTTSSYKDVWFAGYTPYYTCTTWTGFDNNENLSNAGEKNLSKTMWRMVMQRIHENLDYRSFDIPAGITTATVCSGSGLIPVAGVCPAYTEYFAVDNMPSSGCNIHYTGQVCAYSHLPACENCPFKEEGVYTLPLQEPAILHTGQNAVTEADLSPTTCPHNDAFFSDRSVYAPILVQQAQELAAEGKVFSLDGY